MVNSELEAVQKEAVVTNSGITQAFVERDWGETVSETLKERNLCGVELS
jgi:hypothetical protein